MDSEVKEMVVGEYGNVRLLVKQLTPKDKAHTVLTPKGKAHTVLTLKGKVHTVLTPKGKVHIVETAFCNYIYL